MLITKLDKQIIGTTKALKQAKPYILSYTNAIRKVAVAKAKSLKPVNVSDFSIGNSIEELTSLLVYNYLLRYQELEESTKRVDLGAYSKEIRSIGSKLGVDIGRLSTNMRKLAEYRHTQSLWEVRRRLNAEIKRGAAAGEAKVKRIYRVEQLLLSMGVSPRSPSYVSTLINTHIMEARNIAAYQQTQTDRRIEAYTYVTVGDDRVRPEHQQLEGITKPKNHPVWKIIWPPNGWNCRCEIVGLTGEFKSTRLPNNVKGLIDPEFLNTYRLN